MVTGITGILTVTSSKWSIFIDRKKGRAANDSRRAFYLALKLVFNEKSKHLHVLLSCPTYAVRFACSFRRYIPQNR